MVFGSSICFFYFSLLTDWDQYMRCRPPVVLKERSSTFSFSHLQHLIVLMVGDVFFILSLLNPTLSPQYASVFSCLTVDIFLRRTCLALSVLFLISAFLSLNPLTPLGNEPDKMVLVFTLYFVTEMSAVLALLERNNAERWGWTWELLSSKNCFQQLHFLLQPLAVM